MEKLIEMTLDGRLTMVWVGVAALILVVIYEAWPMIVAHRRDRARRVYLARRYGKSAKYLR